MNFTFPALFAGFIFSVFGLYAIKEGRRKPSLELVLVGASLMVFTYFISNIWIIWILGLSLSYIAYSLWK